MSNRIPLEKLGRFSGDQVALAQGLLKRYIESPQVSSRYSHRQLLQLSDIGSHALATEYFLEIASHSFDHNYMAAKRRGSELERRAIRELQTNVSPLIAEVMNNGWIL